MKRFVVTALSLLLVWTATRLVAQDAPETDFDPFSPVHEAEPTDPAAAAPDETPQRDRFLEIMRAKAELMDEAELDAAIQRAEAEIQELQARRLLTDARETLLRLIETYPETPSADAARRMLGREPVPEGQPFPAYEEAPSFTAPAEPQPFLELEADSVPVFEDPGFSPPPAD